MLWYSKELLCNSNIMINGLVELIVNIIITTFFKGSF